MSARPCSDLGVCQGRTPACEGCKPHLFAPGVIERHARPLVSPAQRRELLRWLQITLLAMAIAGGTALVACLFVGV